MACPTPLTGRNLMTKATASVDVENRIRWEPEIVALATQHGYQVESRQPSIGLLIFVKPGIQINVYTTRMTVATILNHPKKGITQLFRRRVTFELLGEIFSNPRVHTKWHEPYHGYLRRKDR